ncbi:MAG: ankyrin repeat domain-containing protein [Cyanobacteria bacterium]|nr:ankyrin repeat domain-containing protein [Cyanobacteriota bacterium]
MSLSVGSSSFLPSIKPSKMIASAMTGLSRFSEAASSPLHQRLHFSGEGDAFVMQGPTESGLMKQLKAYEGNNLPLFFKDRPSLGEYYFKRAIDLKDLPAVQKVVAMGGDVNKTDKNDYTLLMRCVNTQDGLEIFQYLISQGADINAINADGKTVLHHVAQLGKLPYAICLIEKGANFSLLNKEGKTAEKVARLEGKTDVADFLQSVRLQAESASSLQ